MAAAAVEEKGFRPGVVSVVQTFGDRANFHPHVHALVSRGGWTASGEWIPVPYVDEGTAERLFRHKVLALLRGRGLLSEERIELLLSWRRSGFSVHNQVYVPPGDGRGLEALVRYMMRPPGEPLPAELRPRLVRGRLRVQRRARRARTDRGREDRCDGISSAGPGADPGPKTPFGPLLRLLLECGPGQAQEGRRAGRALLPRRGTRGGNHAAEGRPRGPQASMGGVDPPGVRSRPPRVSPLRRRDARGGLHHPARLDQAHPRSSPKARKALSPAPACPAASGQLRLRSPSPAWQGAEKGRGLGS